MALIAVSQGRQESQGNARRGFVSVSDSDLLGPRGGKVEHRSIEHVAPFFRNLQFWPNKDQQNTFET